MKIRFYSWCFVIAILLSMAVMQILQGIKLNTNILDLLPQSAVSNDMETASNIFTDNMSKQVIFLVGNHDKKSAEEAADVFVKNLVSNKVPMDLNYRLSEKEQSAWGSFYYPARLGLLTQSDRSLLENNEYKTIADNALATLYSPFGISNSTLLENDPFFLFLHYVTAKTSAAKNVALQDGYLMAQYHDHWYVLIPGKITGDSFSLQEQKQFISHINTAKDTVKKTYPATQFLQTGVIFYAAQAAATAQRDVTLISIGSLMGIVLLLLFTFRSLSPLLFTLACLSVGFMAAFVITQALFGELYLFTLVFGASLMGIAVDYSFFYYAERQYAVTHWNSEAALKHIFPGITLGLISVCIAFTLVAFTPFPGLKQLALFAIMGLSFAYGTVVCFFPYWLKKKTEPKTTLMMRISAYYLRFCQSLSKNVKVFLFLLLVCYGAIGLSQLSVDDNIQHLQGLSKTLISEEKTLKEILDLHTSMNFILVKGYSTEEVLQNAENIMSSVRLQRTKNNDDLLGLPSYIPSSQEQEKNRALNINLINHELLPYLTKIGFPETKAKSIQENLLTSPKKVLTLQDWLESPVSNALKYLWLGEINHQYYTVLLLPEGVSEQKIQTVLKTNLKGYYVNKTQQMSHIFAYYRELLLKMLFVIFFAMAILFMLRYGKRKGWKYLSLPFMACLFSLASLGYFHIPLTLFNTLALLLVMGLSLDYVIFFAESRGTPKNTMLAVFLSALTTLLSFGLLCLSHTPVIRNFGLTVMLGVMSAFLLSPIYAISREK